MYCLFYEKDLLLEATRLGAHHFKLVHDRFVEKAEHLQGLMRKHVHGDIDPLVALRNVFEADNAYIVSGYLVVFNLTEMWWSDTPILAEQLVFALEPTDGFSAVTEFLEQKAREAGAKFVCVGTALAKNDKALASLYEKQGYQRMAINLAKEIS